MNSQQAQTAAWLGHPAPRYTSFPPAPFFQTTVGANDYTRALAALPADEPVSLYVHIPFCQSLCLYCGCNTLVTHRDERIQLYLDSLGTEIDRIAALTGRRQVRHLHFGGGTPNRLPLSAMQALFAHLRRAFDLDAPREIAMELDPRLVTQEQAQMLAACGVTRVSLGIQDFDNQVQTIIGRVQPYEQVAQACAWLRAAGIAKINFDLIYGLPGQTVATVTDTAQRACGLAPDRVAVFSYAHVPRLKKHQRALEAYGIPDDGEKLALEQIARGILIQNGYQPIGIDHYALPQDSLTQAWREARVHRCFQGYSEDPTPTLIGLGASSISQTAQGYFQNDPDERTYQAVIASGRIPIKRGFLLSREDIVRRAIIEQLMCRLTCDIEEICRAYDFPVATFAPDIKNLSPYEEAGLITRRGTLLCLTTPHRMAIRVICKAFDPYTRNSTALSSRAA